MSAVYVTPQYSDAYVPDISAADAVLKSGTIALRCAVAGVVKVDLLNGATGVSIPLSPGGPDLVIKGITLLYKVGTTATGIVAFV